MDELMNRLSSLCTSLSVIGSCGVCYWEGCGMYIEQYRSPNIISQRAVLRCSFHYHVS